MTMTAMRNGIFGAVLFTAAANSAYGQGGAAPKTAPDSAPVPPELTVAPITPKRVPEPTASGGGKPANICQELLAFVEHQMQTTAATAEQGASNPSSAPQAPPDIDVPQQRSGITTPVPPPESAQRPPFVSLEQARGLLSQNDLLACQEAARQMRRAGVPMPDGLIALAGLRPDLLKATLDGR
jgi:hypothetical protein